MSKCTDLLYIENILHLFLNDNIFTIKLLGGKFNDEIINQMYKTLEIFYNICKKNNKKFYHIYDFSNCKLINAPNYINYVNSIISFLKKNEEFYKTNLYGTAFITQNGFSKYVCNLVLKQYTPVRPIKFFTNDESIDFSFSNI